jgi:pectinesterase
MRPRRILPVALLCCVPAWAWAGEALTVAADGSGDFRAVQAAVDAVPDGNPARVVIHIKPGTYKEKITVPASRPFITFRGDDAKTTILTNDWNAKHVGPDGRPVGTGGSYSTKVNGRDFVAEEITFENTAGDTGQAVAVFADADRLVFRNCRFLGWQDTLYANGGRQYYDRCEIEGRVDFIFGGATAVFDRCTIRSKNGGYVTAASTSQDRPFGYVFLDCTLAGDVAKTYLGRPWRPYGAVAYIRCWIGDHVVPEGWDNWRNPENEKTARYVEYRCTGPGAERSKRVAWSRELTDEEAATYTVRNILGGADGWDPTRAPARPGG